MHEVLRDLLQQVQLCAIWDLWEQARVPLLQRHEELQGQGQMPLIIFFFHHPHINFKPLIQSLPCMYISTLEIFHHGPLLADYVYYLYCCVCVLHKEKNLVTLVGSDMHDT